jgi:hypothetical protein
VKATAPAPVTAAERKSRTVVYPVADLLGKGKETRLDDLEDLVSVVTTTVEPKSWAENGGDGTVEFYVRSRALVVNQSSEIHERIADLLAGLRKAKELSESDPHKPAHTPSAGRAAKSAALEGCCEECAEAAKQCAKKSAAKSCCEECKKCCDGCNECKKCCDGSTATSVLTLPPAPRAGADEDSELELVIEGCTEESGSAAAPEAFKPVDAAPANGLRCAGLGLCAEADAGSDGLRFRWQFPVGPLTVLVEYERHSLSLGLGIGGRSDDHTEESEAPN